jgi:CheY-like chemotaxis protein
VVIEVADTGSGVPPELVEQIFEPFFTTKAPGKGTGLGLSMCKSVVVQAGGTITLDSTPGRGSTFRVVLPAADAVADAPGPAAPPPAEPAAPAGATVLVVDDNPLVRGAAERLLAEAGYRVIAAAGGAEALASLASLQGRLDLIVTDVMMPRMSGVVLAERLRAAAPDLRVIFTSGYAGDDVAGRVPPGALVLGKPYAPEQLLAMVRQALPPR